MKNISRLIKYPRQQKRELPFRSRETGYFIPICVAAFGGGMEVTMDSRVKTGIDMHSRLVTICEGAILVALAVGLSFLEVRLFPTGGSLDFVMIPLMVFALRRGAGWGIGAGLVFGTLHCIFTGGVAFGWQSMILDYMVAYSFVGLAGFFRDNPVIGVSAGALARYLMHVLSGVIIWGEYMPDEFLGLTMTNTAVYSLLYNATYMLPNYIVVLILIIPLSRVPKFLKVDN